MLKIGSLTKIIASISFLSLAGVLVHDYYDSFYVHRFRRSDGVFKKTDSSSLPSREGLDGLLISGSKRPSPQGLRDCLKDIKVPIYVFDLQGEGHYYIQDVPQAWYGYTWQGEVGVDVDDIHLRHYVRRILYTGKLRNTVEDVESEDVVMKRSGLNYLIIPISRGTIPTASQVDELIQTLANLPQPSWVHFHCFNGAGRTSLAMIMFDTLRNGKSLSIEEIVKRQHLLGSENVFDTDVRAKGTYTKEALERRRDFVIAFHRFVNDPEGYGHTSWKEWSSKYEVYPKIGFAEGAV